MPTVPACVLRRFVRTGGPEDGVLTYRPAAVVPRTRLPQRTLDLAADGTLIRGVPGPADGRVRHRGRWIAVTADRLILRWQDASPDTLVEIVACADDVLLIKVLSGSLD